jgi:hypothetical protein
MAIDATAAPLIDAQWGGVTSGVLAASRSATLPRKTVRSTSLPGRLSCGSGASRSSRRTALRDCCRSRTQACRLDALFGEPCLCASHQRRCNARATCLARHKKLIKLVTLEDIESDRRADAAGHADIGEGGLQPRTKAIERTKADQLRPRQQRVCLMPAGMPQPREIIDLGRICQSHLHRRYPVTFGKKASMPPHIHKAVAASPSRTIAMRVRPQSA